MSEENTFFRLHERAAFLRQLIQETEFVQPASFRAEVLGWIDQGLPDLSLTRANVSWGIPVPDLPEEVLYVFGVDALTNYLTGLGFPEGSGWEAAFPKSVHVIGKEILRFHALYWPALLDGAGFPLPRGLQVHGHFTVEGEKISKTAGNGIDPLELAEAWGNDALRYSLLRAKPFDRDGDFSRVRAIEQWNAELSGGLGNWAQRVTTLSVKHRQGRPRPLPSVLHSEDRGLLEEFGAAADQADAHTEAFRFDRALQCLANGVAAASRHLEILRPWQLAGQKDATAQRRFDECIEVHRQALCRAVQVVAPYTPRAATELRRRLAPSLSAGDPIYPRLETA